MKIKDLPSHASPDGLKVKTRKGVIGYYISAFTGGVFLRETPDHLVGVRLYPQLASNEAIKQWDIVNEDTKCNCDVLTRLNHTVDE